MRTAETTAPTLDFKIAFLGPLLREFGDRPLRVLDMGCGTAKDWPSILREHPAVIYTGVEPDARSRATANDLLRGLPAKVLAGWGEATDMGDGFDLTLSLSVLEHVKYLDPFLRASVASTRPSGTIVHRYDLGHSLYPANHYERVLVTLSRRAPWVVPASRFTTHVEPSRVVNTLSALGVSAIQVSYAQMYSLKQAMNRLSRMEDGLDVSKHVLDLDAEVSRILRPRVSAREMAHLFPSVTVRGIKGQ
jgi:SAM-dependent methyltransferase